MLHFCEVQTCRAADKSCLIFIYQVKAEVSRLEEMKASKMKELVLKKKAELEDICRKTHLIPESNSSIDLAVEAVESGIYLYVLKIMIHSFFRFATLTFLLF